MRIKSVWISLLAFPTLLFAFQNCGKGLSSAGIESSATTSNTIDSGFTPVLPTANDPLSSSVLDSSTIANMSLSVEIRLNKVDAADVLVNYSTMNGTAVSGVHFTSTMGAVTVPSGSMSVRVQIPILKSESTIVSFGLKIDSVSNGLIGRAEGKLSIPVNAVPVAQLKNQWLPITTSGAPSVRYSHTAVSAGSKMIVWGGFNSVNGPLNDGGIYDPATNIWLPINLIGAPSAGRSGHSAVWTGSKMIVWGGAGNFSTQRNLNDGGLYDPTTNSWQPLNVNGAPSGRNGHKAFWTGTKMIIWGGWNQLNSGAETLLNNGGLYDPGTNAWQPLNVNGAPSGRYLSSAIWTGSKMIVWGGSGPNGIGTFNNGGIYDPTTNTWQSINLIGAPSARAGHSAVWTGSKMIIWGGNINRITFNDGGIYDPLTNTWQPIGLNGSPSGRYDHTSVWTGSKMIVWGGTESVNGSFIRRDNGGIYDPLSNSWQPLNLSGVPSVRTVPSALWTGSKMVIWGGYTTGGQLNTGGVFE